MKGILQTALLCVALIPGVPMAGQVVRQADARAAGSASTPRPVWHVRLPPGSVVGGPGWGHLAAANTLLIARSQALDRLVALDQRTGAEVWRRGTWPAPTAAPGERRGTSEHWYVVGSAPDPNTGESVILCVYRGWEVPASDTSKRRWEESLSLQAVDAATGEILWREAGDAARALGVFGGVVALPPSTAPRNLAELHDARSGARLDPADPDDAALLARAVEGNGSPTALANGISAPLLVDLRTGALQAVPIPPSHLHYTSPTPLFRGAGDSIVVHIDRDDDGVGHSGWPKYLYCCDTDGRKRWQFPARFRFSDPEGMLATGSSHIEQAVPLPRVGTIVARDAGRTFYGVRTLDGKPLWEWASRDGMVHAMLRDARGVFVLTGRLKATDSLLWFIDGTRGRPYGPTRLPTASAAAASDTGLYLLSRAGDLYAFPIEGLRPPSTR